MTYLYQAIKAALSDWIATAWKALKAKAIAELRKLWLRNTGNK